MKQFFTIIFIISISFINGQEFFEYEQKIENPDRYNLHEIEFQNTNENFKLFGTLITPKTFFNKVIIIVPGSGLDTRNSHFILTQELLNNNIAVFRYDERGVGKSAGDNAHFRYGISKITDDLIFAIKSLKKNPVLTDKKIGLLGHSQGGMATIGALKNNEEIDFLIQWATPVQKHGEFFKYQIKTGVNKFDSQLKFNNDNKKIEIISIAQRVIQENLADDDLKLSRKINKETKKNGYKRRNYDRFQFWTFPSMKDMLRQNFEATYKKSVIPILYIIGSNDKFVDPITNAELLKKFKNKNIDIQIIDGLNHYLTRTNIDLNNLKMVSSFYKIDKLALKTIINWIRTQ